MTRGPDVTLSQQGLGLEITLGKWGFRGYSGVARAPIAAGYPGDQLRESESLSRIAVEGVDSPSGIGVQGIDSPSRIGVQWIDFTLGNGAFITLGNMGVYHPRELGFYYSWELESYGLRAPSGIWGLPRSSAGTRCSGACASLRCGIPRGPTSRNGVTFGNWGSGIRNHSRGLGSYHPRGSGFDHPREYRVHRLREL